MPKYLKMLIELSSKNKYNPPLKIKKKKKAYTFT